MPRERHGQGLRVRQGPVRHVHARGAEGARGAVAPRQSRSSSSSRSRGRPALLREDATTSGPTRAASSAYKLLAEAMRETGRVRARQVRRARQAVPRLLRPVDGGLDHAAAPLRRRGAAVLGGPASDDADVKPDGARPRQAPGRAARLGQVPARDVRGRGQEAHSAERSQRKVAGPGDHRSPRPSRAARSST